MTKPLIALPSNSPSPLNVHVNRNGFKESLHEIDVAVCDADGSVILGMGDVESVIFPRSAMKTNTVDCIDRASKNPAR